ncbi:hypothetical protein BDZ97DRAFT_1669109, partial [Flammula alnicola]
LVFRWLFIPWLQKELDAWVDRYNNSRKRADRNKILPHGVPNDICAFPERFGAMDFKVKVEEEAIDYVEQLYAPPDDPVFELVPPTFAYYTQIMYDDMGTPAVTGESVWDIYRGLV